MAQVLHTENTNRTTNTVEPSLNTQQIVLTDDVIPNDSDALQSGLQAQLDSSFPQDFEGKKDLILSRRDATCGGVSDQGVLKGDEGNVGLLGSGDGSGTEFGKECGPDVGRECGVKKSGGRPKSFVWQYYSQVSDANNKSKRCRVLCQACGEEFVSRVEQMEAHLAHHCSKTDPEVAEIMKARIAAAKAAAKLKKESGLRQAALSASATTIRAAMPINAPLPKRQKIEVASPSSQNVIPLHLRYPQVTLPPHPLIQHWLSVCRNKETPSPIFRNSIAELGRLLIYEASEDWLPSVAGQVNAPFGIADCRFIDPTKPVKIVPILRAGTVLLESAATLLPSSETYHVAQTQDNMTMQANMYLNKLPISLAPDDRVLICDPMLATGNTVLNVLNELVSRGASQEYVRIVTVLIAPSALELISKQFPGSRIYAAMIDAGLSEAGFIVPGLGDAGDRCFGTV